MSQLGLGAMIHMLAGGSDHEAKEYVGAQITSADITDERLTLGLEDGRKIQIWDNG